MARSLVQEEPVFAATLRACDAVLQPLLGWSVWDATTASHGPPLVDSAVVQPALFAFAVALASLWRSWGVVPHALVGHSQGELAAACVSGALRLADAAQIVVARTRLLDSLRGRGAMALAEAPGELVQRLLAQTAAVSLAAENGPTSFVLAGEPQAIDQLVEQLIASGSFARRIQVDYASHCALVEPILPLLQSALGDLKAQRGEWPIYSTVDDAVLDGRELSGSYFVRNLRAPVRYQRALRRLVADGFRFFIELSPHPLLLTATAAQVEPPPVGGLAVASLRRDQGGRRHLLRALASLHVNGLPVDLAAAQSRPGHVVSLPAYPFQRQRYVREPAAADVSRGGASLAAAHPLLGAAVVAAFHPEEKSWEQVLELQHLPWLADHRVDQAILFPGAGFAELALAAGRLVRRPAAGEVCIEDLQLHHALLLAPATPIVLHAALREVEPGRFHFLQGVITKDATEPRFQRHSQATIRLPPASPPPMVDLEAARRRCPRVLAPEQFYPSMAEYGLHYGPAFQGIHSLCVGAGEAVAELVLPGQATPSDHYVIHPALLDACWQTAWVVAFDAGWLASGPMLPVAVGQLRVWAAAPERVFCHTRLGPAAEADGSLIAQLQLVDPQGSLWAEVKDLLLKPLAHELAVSPADPLAALGMEIAWRSVPRDRQVRPQGRWVLLGTGPLAARLAVALHGVGAEPILFSAAAATELLPALTQHGGPAVAGVVVLPTPTLGADWLTALSAVHALAAAALPTTPPLFLVTERSQPVDLTAAVQPDQALLWGFGATVHTEAPWLPCRRIDLNSTTEPAQLEALLWELATPTPEEQVVLRGAARWVPRLVRRPLAALPPVALGGLPLPQRAPADAVPQMPVRPDASYLVTGGLGGLGHSVAAWLTSLGAGHLILLTRPGTLTPRQETQLAQLRTLPCRITMAHADVADRQALAAVLAAVPADLPLRGVIHLAAVLDDAPLEQLNAERLWTVLRPKVLGAWNLHELTQGLSLDFFVLYSSAAALLGTAGQANYAAANAYLDALAHHRRAHQLPATSLNWGAFAEVGLAAAQKVRGQRLQQSGLAGLSAAEGIAVLRQVLGHPVPQVAALRFSPQRWVQAHPHLAGWPFLSELLPASTSSASSEKGAARPLLIQLLAGLDADRRRQRIREEVQALVAAVIRTQATHINPSTPLRDLGIDSLMAVELRNRLESATALRLKSTLVFSYPTVQALADHLAEALSPPPPAPALPDLNELSDSELEAEALKRLGADSDTQGT